MIRWLPQVWAQRRSAKRAMARMSKREQLAAELGYTSIPHLLSRLSREEVGRRAGIAAEVEREGLQK
jgi:hypothetical protein